MGEEQGALARSFEILTDALEAPDVDADYRIAFTTTDNGHIECRGTRPGTGGKLRLESCLDRESEFVSPAGTVSRFNTACASACRHADAELAIQPTETAVDTQLAPRPWLEGGRGGSNLPEGVSMSQALACYAPQGINGCGYEAQLESAYRALGLSLEPSQDSFGFMRDDALLMLVFITDEADCSYNHRAQDVESVFSKDNSTFWTNPSVGPNSSICWNAGVACSGDDAGFYEECVSATYAADGTVLPDSEDSDAVLYPVERYKVFLDAIAINKADHGVQNGVFAAVIGGVAEDGHAVYPSDTSSSHATIFGTDPGCIGEVDVLDEVDPNTGEVVPAVQNVDSFAVPPVRLREFAERYAHEADPSTYMHSICDGNLDAAMYSIAQSLAEALRGS